MKGVTGCRSVRSVRMDGEPSPMNVTTVFYASEAALKLSRKQDKFWEEHEERMRAGQAILNTTPDYPNTT